MNASFELLIDGVTEQQFGSIAGFVDSTLVADLRNRLLECHEQGLMKPAGIGKDSSYNQNQKVRGDEIFWLDKENHPVEKAFLERVEGLISYLNQTCYTGLNGYEFHFARYKPGSFYRRHLDRFKTDSGRVFSLICYLNENWTPEDGGQLILHLPDQQVTVLPVGGQAVFFKSNEVEHEVAEAHRERLSIAGWLKRN
jgi:SM-20-related protein